MYKSATKVIVSLIINCYKNKIGVLSSYRLVKKLVFLQNALSLLRESDLFHAMCHHWKFKKIWTGILELLLSMHGLYHFTMMEEYYIIGMQYRLLQTVITLHSILCCNTFVILNYLHKIFLDFSPRIQGYHILCGEMRTAVTGKNCLVNESLD